MTYYVILSCDFEQSVNGTTVYFKANATYPLVDSYVNVLGDDGLLTEVHQITYEEETINVPTEYSAIIKETEVPTYQTEVEKWLAERTDYTTDYLTAFSDRLDIQVNADADVDASSYIEPQNLTREDPEE